MEEGADRVERLLALLLIQQARTQQDKIVQLNVAGFTNTEVADLLQTTTGVVNQVLYQLRKGKGKTKGKKKKGAA
jgi:DNA-directed RNA polymerase specialized sigma24 family protein